MSWSVSYCGTPSAVKCALKKYGAGLTGCSKDEFDLALPNLLGLIDLNYCNSSPVGIYIKAYGSASTSNPKYSHSNCVVSIGSLEYPLAIEVPDPTPGTVPDNTGS